MYSFHTLKISYTQISNMYKEALHTVISFTVACLSYEVRFRGPTQSISSPQHCQTQDLNRQGHPGQGSSSRYQVAVMSHEVQGKSSARPLPCREWSKSIPYVQALSLPPYYIGCMLRGCSNYYKLS